MVKAKTSKQASDHGKVTATGFHFPRSMVRTIRNLGSHQQCSLLTNQREHSRGGTVLSKSPRKLQGGSPALCSRSRSRAGRRALIFESFFSKPPTTIDCRSWEEKGEEKWKRKASTYFSLRLLTCSPLYFSQSDFFSKAASHYHPPYHHFHFAQVLTEPKQLISKCWGRLHLPGSLALSTPISTASLPFIVYLI